MAGDPIVGEPFTVDVANGEADLAAYFADFRKATNPYDALFSGPLVAGALVVGLLGARWLAVGMVVLAGFLASPLGRGWRARERAHRVRSKPVPSFRLTFDADGVHMQTEGARSSVDWSRVTSVIDGKHTLILRVGSSIPWFVPRRLLTDDQAAFVLQRSRSARSSS